MKRKVSLKSKLSMSALPFLTMILLSQCKKEVNAQLSEGSVSLREKTLSATSSTAVLLSRLNVEDAKKDRGYAYFLVPELNAQGDTKNNPNASIVKIFEDGVELGPAHSEHKEIRNIGKGRFSHWGGELYFSSSDNSNPTTNGRTYTYRIGNQEPQQIPMPDDDTPLTDIIGYANVNGKTTGGLGGRIEVVTTQEELAQAISSSNPKIVQISGKIKGSGFVKCNSNKTIIGLSGSSIEGFGILVYGKHNVIIRNVTIKKVLGFSNIVIKEKAHHIWIDHCTLSSERPTNWNLYDGLLDVTREADFVTISWNKFHDNHKCILIGGGDSSVSDKGKLHVTLYNNYFYNISERQPRIRFGTVHVFNNYIKSSSGYGIGVAMGGIVRTDNNYFEGMNTPISTIIGGTPGFISGLNTNIFKSSRANKITTSASSWIPEYSYKSLLLPADKVPAAVVAGAGASK